MSLLSFLDAAHLTNALLGLMYTLTAAVALHSTGRCRRPPVAGAASCDPKARIYTAADTGAALDENFQIHFLAGATSLTLPAGRASLVVANVSAGVACALIGASSVSFGDAHGTRFGELRFKQGQAQTLVWCAEESTYFLAVAGCSFENPQV